MVLAGIQVLANLRLLARPCDALAAASCSLVAFSRVVLSRFCDDAALCAHNLLVGKVRMRVDRVRALGRSRRPGLGDVLARLAA